MIPSERNGIDTIIPGEFITATYMLNGCRDEREARMRAKDICFEQTVEYPEELISSAFIRQHVVGRIDAERISSVQGGRFSVEIQYPVETAAGELTQLLNVVFGNISIKPGIRLVNLKLPDSLLGKFKGPRFGRQGLRRLLGVIKRPLLCSALKPMGSSPEQLADLAGMFALGGLDLIKEDHGLTNQSFARFEKRVKLCSDSVNGANKKTGNCSIYIVNITAPADEILRRARLAKDLGAGGLLLAPGIVGLDTIRMISDDESIALPVIVHPSMQGTYVLGETGGIAHGVLLSLMPRLAGADATIFPNYGGRFSFTPKECREIAEATEHPMGRIASIFPAPAGGMTLRRICPELMDFYGHDVIFLIGGDLMKQGPDVVENCRSFARMVGIEE